MLKEMHEQPTALLQAITGRVTSDDRIELPELADLAAAAPDDRAGRAHRLRHGLLRVARRRGGDPGLGRDPGPREHRLRVPLQPAAARRADARDRGHPVGRDGRHDRPDPARPRARLSDRRRDQHGRLGDHPRGRRGPVPPGRTGDRGRGLEDVRDPGDDPGDPRRGDRQGPRPAWRGAGARARCRSAPPAQAGPGRARRRGRRPRPRPALRQLARVHVRRARLHLPGGARGGAQAQGGQLRPRRGLRGWRAEARPDLAARPGGTARRCRHPLVGLRQADQQRHGGACPGRPGHRRGDRGRRPDRAFRGRGPAGSPTRTRR